MHSDTHVINHVDDVFNLLWIDNAAGQVIIDLRIGQIALLLASGNQFFQLLSFLLAANHCAFFRQDKISSGRMYAND